jgi:hypothetical protein
VARVLRCYSPTLVLLLILIACDKGPLCNGGRTAPVVSASGTLGPNEARAFDVETPPSTSQINVTGSWVVGLAIWAIDPACNMEPVDQCPSLEGGAPLPAPPAGQLNFNMTFGTPQYRPGPRQRIGVKNTLANVSVNFSITIEPWRAGCT